MLRTRIVPVLRAPCANRLATSSRAQQYAVLGKAKLSALVAGTSLAGFAVAWCASEKASGTQSPNKHRRPLFTAAATAAGVFLAAMSAGALNQVIETEHDACMARTRSRPLPAGTLSRASAVRFAALTGASSTAVLFTFAGMLPALLAVGNTLLYAGVYTPLKRRTTHNTAVGAIVGAVPPVIGAVAAAGVSAPALAAGGLLAATMYCWQFPHFCALSWRLRHEYARAGFCMGVGVHPARTMRSAVLHAAALVPVSTALLSGCGTLPVIGAAAVNGTMIAAALRLSSHPSDANARRLFLLSLVHLPVLLSVIVAANFASADENADHVTECTNVLQAA